MLARILALAVVIISILIYFAAFFFPEVHRKNDFIWSGMGLFYGMVLWIFARQITGGLLLGHIASVILLSGLSCQIMYLRYQVVSQKQQNLFPKYISAFKTELKNTFKLTNNDLYSNSVIRLFKSLGGIFSIDKNKSPTIAGTTTNTDNLDEVVIDARASNVTTIRENPSDKMEVQLETIPSTLPFEEVKTLQKEPKPSTSVATEVDGLANPQELPNEETLSSQEDEK